MLLLPMNIRYNFYERKNSCWYIQNHLINFLFRFQAGNFSNPRFFKGGDIVSHEIFIIQTGVVDYPVRVNAPTTWIRNG